ncbi:hypothetical protein GQ44DRAFT_701049 [Phaeosphaeriaceae sp. PMI808]|nr:hypothetical protein GQ44DRAFT_701049 [Phaeosphaeriaceae sp. PMI808]
MLRRWPNLNMLPSLDRRRPISEDKRERDVFLLYGAALRDIPILAEPDSYPKTYNLPVNHVVQPSQDSTLTALAQLATFRLRARRAIISIIDAQYQYILAEATADTSICLKESEGTPNELWYGSVGIPKAWVCYYYF